MHRGDIGFIDFDSFCQAEPALDVAMFRAGIRDYGMTTRLAGGDVTSREAAGATAAALEAVCEGFLQRYEAVAGISRERVLLWETPDLLTYVLHAWTKVSPRRLAERALTLELHLQRSGFTG